MEQVLDVVPDAPGAVGTEVREVLADLGRVHAGQLGEALRRDGRDLAARRSRGGPGSRAGRRATVASGIRRSSGTVPPRRPLGAGWTGPFEAGYRLCARILKVSGLDAGPDAGSDGALTRRPPRSLRPRTPRPAAGSYARGVVVALAFVATALRRCSPRRRSSATPRSTGPRTAPGPSPSPCSPWRRRRWPRGRRPAGTRARSGSSTCSARSSTCRGSRSAPSTCWPPAHRRRVRGVWSCSPASRAA